MELWFTENHTDNVRFSIKIKRKIVNEKTPYQQIDIFDTEEFGKVFVLDGYIMLTEKDEFIYHEMITHPAFAVHPCIKNILVIGAGDGGTIRELTKYDSVEHIDMVEIDERVVAVSKEFLPFTACRLDDPRVHIFYQDGMEYVRARGNEYDLIIVDSTDPLGPGTSLFTREFYSDCFKALHEDGILINQHESPFYKNDAEAAKSIHGKIAGVFPIALVYQFHMPTYPSGHWLFGFASKKYHPVGDIRCADWDTLGIKTKYYNTALHAGSFALPNYVIEILQ